MLPTEQELKEQNQEGEKGVQQSTERRRTLVRKEENKEGGTLRFLPPNLLLQCKKA